jgi:lipopolysaccharide transport system permease protein
MISARMLRDCWDLRGFVLASVRRDFVSRYLGTQLGFFWAIAQPLAMILIYTVIFANIMRPSIPGQNSIFAYSIFLCSGLLTWQLFSDLLTRAMGMFVNNAQLLTKVHLPKLVLPIIATLSALASFAVIALLFFVFLVMIGKFPGAVIIAAVPVIVVVVLFALGLGVTLGVVNVFYRDVAQATAIVVGFWFWLTPIVYTPRTLPEWAMRFMAWNPLFPLFQSLQSIFLESRLPDWGSLVYPTVVALMLVMLGLLAFRRLGGELVDEL